MDEPVGAAKRFHQVEHDGRPGIRKPVAQRFEIEVDRKPLAAVSQYSQRALDGLGLDQDISLGRRRAGLDAIEKNGSERRIGQAGLAPQAALETRRLTGIRCAADSMIQPMRSR